MAFFAGLLHNPYIIIKYHNLHKKATPSVAFSGFLLFSPKRGDTIRANILSFSSSSLCVLCAFAPFARKTAKEPRRRRRRKVFFKTPTARAKALAPYPANRDFYWGSRAAAYPDKHRLTRCLLGVPSPQSLFPSPYKYVTLSPC